MLWFRFQLKILPRYELVKYKVTQRKETYIIYLGTPKFIFILKTIPLFCHSSKYFLNTTYLIFIATTEVLVSSLILQAEETVGDRG